MADTRGLKIGDPVYQVVARVHTVEEKLFGFGPVNYGIPRGPLYVFIDGERIEIADETEEARLAVMADG